MPWKTTAILLIAVLGVGAYITLYEIKQPPPEQRDHEVHQLLSVSPEAVTQLTLELPNVNTTVRHEGAVWRLLPQGVRADPERIEKIVEMLSPLTAERLLKASSGKRLDLKGYGLDPAVGRLTIVEKSGSSTTLLLGERTPVGDNRYVQIEHGAVVGIVPSRLLDEMNQPIETFRDPVLLRFNTWLADGLTMTSPALTFSLTRQDSQWRISARPVVSALVQSTAPASEAVTQPLTDRAERSEVTSLLGHLSTLQIKRFIDDAPRVEQLSVWGFNHPRAEVSLLQQHSSSTPTTVFFGLPLPQDAALIYAKRSDEPALYAVAASDVEELLINLHGLRQKVCFEFITSQVHRVELMWNNQRWTVERSDARSEKTGKTVAQWRVAGTATILDAERVEMFLSQLSNLRLGGFVDDAPSDLSRYGLRPPAGMITVWVGERSEPQRLLVGATVEDSTNRYGRIEGRAAIIRLPNLVTQLVATTPDQLQVSLAQSSNTPAPAGTVLPPTPHR